MSVRDISGYHACQLFPTNYITYALDITVFFEDGISHILSIHVLFYYKFEISSFMQVSKYHAHNNETQAHLL